MWRTVGGVIVGYIVMGAFVFVSFTAAYVGMGPERAFQPGSYNVSVLWAVTSFSLGLVAALLGGFVCVRIARRSLGPRILAGLVVLLGLLMAIPVLTADASSDPGPRGADVGSVEAMTKAKQPVWFALANPVIGAVGVLVGGRLRRNAAVQ